MQDGGVIQDGDKIFLRSDIIIMIMIIIISSSSNIII